MSGARTRGVHLDRPEPQLLPDAVGQFFSDLAAVHWGALLLGLLFFGLNLTLRSRAFFNSLRAAYPAVRFQWRRIWGAYFAAVGFNNVVPGARWRCDQAVPDALLDPRLALSDGRRGVLRGVDLRRLASACSC